MAALLGQYEAMRRQDAEVGLNTGLSFCLPALWTAKIAEGEVVVELSSPNHPPIFFLCLLHTFYHRRSPSTSCVTTTTSSVKS